MTPRAWPERPASRTEQRTLPLPGTLAGRYHIWRQTEEGALFFRRFEGAVLLALQDRPTRLSAKLIWETLRAKHKQSVNNDYHALASREIEDMYPCLAGLFRHRKRTAA